METIDMALEPKSDQLNADDLIAGPATFTIEKVSRGSAEQPVDIHLTERPGRPWRPSKSMRRVLVNAWGPDTSLYAGHRVTLYRDPSVRFGKDEVGGIKVSHLSHITKRTTVSLTVTRGKRAPHSVDPLPVATPNAAAEPTPDDVAGCADRESLGKMWRESGPTMRRVIEARVAELDTETGPES